MYGKFLSEDLNPGPPHSIDNYTCRVTISPKMYSDGNIQLLLQGLRLHISARTIFDLRRHVFGCDWWVRDI